MGQNGLVAGGEDASLDAQGTRVTEKLCYTVKEASGALRVNRATIFEPLEYGRLRRVKIGAKTIMLRSSVDALLHDGG